MASTIGTSIDLYSIAMEQYNNTRTPAHVQGSDFKPTVPQPVSNSPDTWPRSSESPAFNPESPMMPTSPTEYFPGTPVSHPHIPVSPAFVSPNYQHVSPNARSRNLESPAYTPGFPVLGLPSPNCNPVSPVSRPYIPVSRVWGPMSSTYPLPSPVPHSYIPVSPAYTPEMLESEDQKKAADTAEAKSHAAVQAEVVFEQEPVAAQEPTIAPDDDRQDYEYYGEMEAKASSAEISDANAAAEPDSEDDLRDYEYYEQLEQKEVVAAGPEDELPDFEYYEELERRQAAEKMPKVQAQQSTPELVAIQQLNSYSPASSASLTPFSNAHPEAGVKTYPTPSLSSSPVEVDMQYDADAESDADSPDRSFVCARNRLIGQAKAQRKANKAMRNRLRRVEGCKKYESATLKSLEKELGALKDEGQDLEMKLGMAQVAALVRIQGVRKTNGGAGN